ncbi:MAG: tRNA (N6-isopentenyl adenosine(37)-C2)-methylthiotransferase MiaB [Bacteroidetes bacterium]|nr:tRNA (N6-isopentenyl adenosine(37)-C2)-methylthiotransferase MiaB [Bacteroidota bacterium]
MENPAYNIISNPGKPEGTKTGNNSGKKLFLESYGCQMNFSDSEIVASILSDAGFTATGNVHESDVALLNTCSIRDHAEQRVRHRLDEFQSVKKRKPHLVIGILGCMAERLKTKLLEEEKIVDIIAGPDSYRQLPLLLKQVESGRKAINTILSAEETYADITPVRINGNGVTAFISIMRGCDNMCSFCVVPFTRGRERSRNPETIVEEAKSLFDTGYREVTLLGQNVDSYLWHPLLGTKKEIIKEKANADAEDKADTVGFPDLLGLVATINPLLRVRFSTSYPKDISDEVINVMMKHENICRHIHLPVQSGSDDVLMRMNRGYTRDWYLDRVKKIRSVIPGCAISTDIITGFCGETEDDQIMTLSLMDEVRFDFAYMFKYSERPGTPAAKKYKDDVPDEIKTKRLQEVIALQQKLSLESNRRAVGKIHKVLVEGKSKRSDKHLFGRNTQNAVVVFPEGTCKPGDYVNVIADGCTAATLTGKVIG